MGFKYDDVAECSSSVVHMDDLSFECSSGEDGCTFGDRVTVTGQFTTTLPIPNEVNVKIQICKFWGSLCTPYLVDTDLNICNFIGDGQASGEADDEYYCAAAGTYDYQTDFTLPEAAIANTNFAVNGVSFRIYLLVNNELTCNAQFTTIKSESYASTEFSVLGAAAFFMSGYSAYEIRKRKLRTAAQVDLKAEEERQNDGKKAVHFADQYVIL